MACSQSCSRSYPRRYTRDEIQNGATNAVNIDTSDDIENFATIDGLVKPFTVRHSYKLLKTIMFEILQKNPESRDEMKEIIQKIQRKYKVSLANSELLYIYKLICKKEKIVYDEKYKTLLQARSFRSQSGVMVFTLVLSPFPNGQSFSCEYDCKYCPLEPGQPRSYMKEEPGVSRANRYNFDPVMQFRDRGFSYIANGHEVDKAEVIILGGTWSSFPESYKTEFITKMYYGANTFFDSENVENLRPMLTLVEEMKINETTECKIIGVTIETRPDCIDKTELRRLRDYGVTRVQLGIQDINDRILDRVDRRCHSKHAISAIKLLKTHCFKVDCHWMPDLPKPLKTNVNKFKKDLTIDDIDWDFDMYESNRKMFKTIIESEEWQTDQWKIYPYEVVPYTRLEQEFKNGLHVPYSNDIVDETIEVRKGKKLNKLHKLLIEVKSNVPEWIRLNRIIRDIPTQHILGGNDDVSMRQSLNSTMKKMGLRCKCIRCREVKKQKINTNNAKFITRTYKGSGGTEHFMSFETPNEEILFGFLRLRFDTENSQKGLEFEELKGCALIRELHVYGQTTVAQISNIDKENIVNDGTEPESQMKSKKYQHTGFGTKLLHYAFDLAKLNGYKKIAVISGNGVKNYYRKFGFEDEGLYMVKYFDENNSTNEINNIQDVTLMEKIGKTVKIASITCAIIYTTYKLLNKYLLK